MAIQAIDSEYCAFTEKCRYTFVMDSDADVANLPVCCPGSTAIVAGSGGGVYMVNASGEWEAL